MMIERVLLPDKIAILANRTYRFEIPAGAQQTELVVAGRFQFSNGVSFMPTACGLLAFDFGGTSLGGFTRLEFRGVGAIPAEVTSNHDDFIALQIRRVRFATFAAACVYGTHISVSHTSMREPHYPGLADIFGWNERAQIIMLSSQDYSALLARLPGDAERERFPDSTRTISNATLVKGVALTERLLLQTGRFRVADPQSMIVMAYQAMRLHGMQHAGASIALAATVVEVALQEVASNSMAVNKAKEMKLAALTSHLTATNVLDANFAARINRLRNARNTLMHENEDGTPRQSGEALTVVRDVLRLCTGESEFDLNTGWSYRF